MNNFRQFFTVAVTAFVVTFPFAFVACGDDSLSANDVPVSQAGAGLESSSSVGDDDATISSPENDETLSSSSVADASGVEQEGAKQPSHTITHTAECTIDNEGLYETVIDTVTVYPDGKVWDRDVYYHCESGEWVETECRDPLEACAGNNEGEYQDVVCSSNPGNPKASKTTWTFKCANNKWEKLSDEEKRQLEFEREMVKADATCNEQYQPEPKLGDVCGITKQGGNVSFGIVIYTLVCYVYTEEGWVAKGSAVMSENTSCEDILNPPAE